MATLLDNLNDVIANWDRIGYPALVERFVVRNGCAYEPCDLIGSRGAQKDCFRNAALFALNGGYECRYVEGFAIRAGIWFPVHHAWVEVDGKAMDNTWRDPFECQYFGVPIETDLLRDELLRNKVYGLFDTGMINTDLLFRIDPELQQFLKEAKAS